MTREFDLENLFNRKLVVVSGKGGVGKTTVSLALAILAARRGKKVLVAEVNSEEQVSHLLDRSPIGYRETRLLPDLWPDLWGINIQPKKAFEEYVLMQIKFRKLYRAVFENRLVRYFIDATPGLGDLMCIGKIYSLVDRYDLVIVDAPATGHSMALFEIPSIVSKAVRVGPLKTEADRIDRLLHDSKKTVMTLVTLPEEMPIAEAVEMRRNLEEKLKLSLGPLFLNQFQKTAFVEKEKTEIEKRKKEMDPSLWKVLDLEMTRAEMSAVYSERLAAEAKGHPIVPIPFIYSTRFRLKEIETMAAEIEKR